MPVEEVPHEVGEAMIEQVRGGDIYRDREARPGLRPFGALGQRIVEEQGGERRHQLGLFR